MTRKDTEADRLEADLRDASTEFGPTTPALLLVIGRILLLIARRLGRLP